MSQTITRFPFLLQVVVLALSHLAWYGYEFSLQFEAGAKWDGYAPGLTAGWLFGRRIDLSDAQWREFRGAAPALAAAFAAFAALSRLVQWRAARQGPSQHDRLVFCVACAAAYLMYLHGACAAFVFGLVALNWAVAQNAAGRPWGAVIVWGFNIAVLLAVRVNDGFPFAALLGPQFAWLDGHRGPVRWHICFNLTTLRMLSYGLDLHWARRKGPAPPIEQSESLQNDKKTAAVAVGGSGDMVSSPRSPKERQQSALPSERDYSLLPCLAHALYPPLYLAGPIITYQDFMWQVRHAAAAQHAAAAGRAMGAAAEKQQQQVTGSSSIWRYACRLGADLTCIELVTHLLYFNSLAVHRIGLRYKVYGLRYGAPEVGLTGWWVLTFMWLKFAVIWRTFRLASLLEGIEPPENMVRCFADNYDVEGFWRGWHASYNRWLVRYMYVPMGGTAMRALSIWPIFLFVALWHDLEWRLLSWAWLICFAFLPEMAAKRLAASPRFDPGRNGAGFRAVCAAAAAVNISGLMAVNMVGFVVGLGGMADLFRELLASPRYTGAALVSFFCGAQLIFAWRRREQLVDAVKRGAAT